MTRTDVKPVRAITVSAGQAHVRGGLLFGLILLSVLALLVARPVII